MSHIRVYYDGFELTKYILVKRIIPVTSKRSNAFSHTNPRLNGRKWLQTKDEGLTISIEAYIREDVMRARDELVKILYNPTKPVELYLSDYPDRALICLFDGEIKPTSRVRNAGITLTFVSEKPYWVSRQARKNYLANPTGTIEVNNEGTYRTSPRFNVKFRNECGYLALVSPWGYVGVGNAKELDKIPVPPSEYVINDTLTDIATKNWQRLPNLEHYVTDYKALTSKGKTAHDPWGMIIDRNSFNPSNPDVWQGHAYAKEFSQGIVHKQADNFHVRFNLHMQDTSGRTNRTCAVLLVVTDQFNNPIMTTSIYDGTQDRNWLNTSFKVNSFTNDHRHSTIIHTGGLASLIGYVEMRKVGNKFYWHIHTDSSTTTGSAEPAVGDTVYIAGHARTGYHSNGTAYNIAGFTRGRPHKISDVRTRAGHKEYLITYQSTPIYWMRANDLENTRTAQRIVGPSDIRHSIVHDNLAQMQPHKVEIWQAVWGNTEPYTRFGIHQCTVNRLYTINAIEVENVFRPGDELVVDCQRGEILLNGDTFQGQVDPESRFFTIDYGKSELQVLKSAWATMPDVSINFEERYL